MLKVQDIVAGLKNSLLDHSQLVAVIVLILSRAKGDLYGYTAKIASK